MYLKAIYIDDEPDHLELFVEMFSRGDVVFETYSCPQEGLEAAKKGHVDLIFIDYRMPGMNGDKLAQELPASLPKALITGELEVTTEVKFDRVFYKPFDPTQVFDFIKEVQSSKLG